MFNQNTFNALTSNEKANYSSNSSGWFEDSRNTKIARENKPQFTIPRIPSENQTFKVLETVQARHDLMGSDYGSGIKKIPLGADLVREGGVNYGSAISKLGPLGVPQQYRNPEVRDGVRGGEFETSAQKSVYNAFQEKINISTTHVANVDHFETVKNNPGTVKQNTLNVEIRPTHVYKLSDKFTAETLKSNQPIYTKELLEFQLDSGTRTLNRFEPIKSMTVGTQINENKINIYNVKPEVNTKQQFEIQPRIIQDVHALKTNVFHLTDIYPEQNTKNKFETHVRETQDQRSLTNERIQLFDVGSNKNLQHKFDVDKSDQFQHGKSITEKVKVFVPPINKSSSIHEPIPQSVIQSKLKEIQKFDYVPITDQIPKDYSIKVDNIKPLTNRLEISQNQVKSGKNFIH